MNCYRALRASAADTPSANPPYALPPFVASADGHERPRTAGYKNPAFCTLPRSRNLSWARLVELLQEKSVPQALPRELFFCASRAVHGLGFWEWTRLWPA